MGRIHRSQKGEPRRAEPRSGPRHPPDRGPVRNTPTFFPHAATHPGAATVLEPWGRPNADHATSFTSLVLTPADHRASLGRQNEARTRPARTDHSSLPGHLVSSISFACRAAATCSAASCGSTRRTMQSANWPNACSSTLSARASSWTNKPRPCGSGCPRRRTTCLVRPKLGRGSDVFYRLLGRFTAPMRQCGRQC